MASPGPNARTGQSRDHEGQALLGSQASARQSLTARRSRAVDRSRERHGWSIGVRVRPHRAPCGASLPVGRSVFESGRPETGGYPLTVGVEDLRPAEPRQSLLERRKAERDVHRVRQTPPQHRARRPVDDRHKIEKAAPDRDIGVSRPKEFRLRPLAEPDVNLSAHPAPIVHPTTDSRSTNGRMRGADVAPAV
jgi:hypothetical protein